MPQVEPRAIRERAIRLRGRGAEALTAHLAREQGAVREVLVERNGGGRTEHFTPVRIEGRAGDIVRARITGRTNAALLADALDKAA
jgi:threonylcarbamoyladenosine tRNA methylthiotransferase MtaB